ncbi:MAG: hypothetical protein NTY00_07845 [Deltaproteobacteria bacterium]|nr:hypothetical protein [Deltaproteobacteria bacterium]
MTIIKFPSRKNEPAFLNDIKKDGYHIYSLKNAKTPGYYPPELPKYPGVNIKDLKIDDVITIRVFFGIGTGKNMRIDGGHIDVKIEHIDDGEIFAVVMTKLPKGFSLETGSSIEIYEEEMLYKAEVTEH